MMTMTMIMPLRHINSTRSHFVKHPHACWRTDSFYTYVHAPNKCFFFNFTAYRQYIVLIQWSFILIWIQYSLNISPPPASVAPTSSWTFVFIDPFFPLPVRWPHLAAAPPQSIMDPTWFTAGQMFSTQLHSLGALLCIALQLLTAASSVFVEL